MSARSHASISAFTTVGALGIHISILPCCCSATNLFDLGCWRPRSRSRSQSHQSYCEQDGWAIIWSDEFNGAELDTASWTKDSCPPGNSRTRLATASSENVYLKDGALVLKSGGILWNATTNQWQGLTAGAVDSKEKYPFGDLPESLPVGSLDMC